MKLLFQQEFTSTDTVVVQHNSNQDVEIRIIDDGYAINNNLVDRLVFDSADPYNKLTVYLKESATGRVQVLEKEIILVTTVDKTKLDTIQEGAQDNTASNFGVGGIGVYDSKDGYNLRFRNIDAYSNKISVSLDEVNHKIDVNVVEGYLVHQNLSGAGTNSHSQIDSHIGSTLNPHNVTAAQVGNATAQWNANQLQGNSISSGTPSNGQALVWSDSYSAWRATTGVAPATHGSTHISTGSDPIANVVSGGASGLMSGSDKVLLDAYLPSAGQKDALVGTYGTPSSSNKYVTSTDARLKHHNVVTVAISGGDYTSVKSAVDSITDASIINPYVVKVEPGVYYEDPITMKSFVSIIGQGDDMWAVSLVANNSSAHFINGAPASTFQNFSLTGPSGTGYAAINFDTSTVFPFEVRNILIRKGYYGIWCHPSGSFGIVNLWSIVPTYIGTNMNKFIYVSDYGRIGAFECAAVGPPPYTVSYGYYVDGANAELSLDLCSFGITGCVGAYVNNGAKLRANACTFTKGTNAFQIGSGGSNSRVYISGSTIAEDFTYDMKVDTPNSIFQFNGVSHQNKIDVPEGTNFSASFSDASDGYEGQAVLGELWFGDATYTFPLGSYVRNTVSTGLYSGGILTMSTGRGVDITEGYGYLNNGVTTKLIHWLDGYVNLTANKDQSWIVVGEDSVIQESLILPDDRNIITLGTAATNSNSVVLLSQRYVNLEQHVVINHVYAKEVVGPISVSGCMASKYATTSIQLDVDSGSYYIFDNRTEATGHSPITFTYWYRNVSSGWNKVTGQTVIDHEHYDDGSGTLQNIPLLSYKRDLLFLTTDGYDTYYHIVYGQETFLTSGLATVNPNAPDVLLNNGLRIAAIIIQRDSNDIHEVIDQRPKLGQLSSGTTSVTRHGDLTGLDADDHCFSEDTELLTEDGFKLYSDIDDSDKALTLNLKTNRLEYNDIKAKYVYDSFDELISFKNHCGEILVTPGHTMIYKNTTDERKGKKQSSKYLTCTAEEALSKSVFSIPICVLSDGDNSLNFLKLLNIKESSFNKKEKVKYCGKVWCVSVDNKTLVLRRNGLIFIAGNTQYQLRSEKGSASGYCGLGTDTKVSYVYLPITSTPPVDVTKASSSVGASNELCRQDHKHDVSTASASALTVGGSSSEGSATSLARSDHAHSLPAFGSGSGTFCQGNDSRLSDDRTASGLRTATNIVSVSAATAPITGQILKATSSSTATWQTDDVPSLSDIAPVDVTKADAYQGYSTEASRRDHKHNISTAAPDAVAIGNTQAEGSATSLARSDHSHAVSGGTPVSVGTANSDGNATTFARSNHVHDHGSQTSGTLHAAASTSVNGFMSSSDKTKLDGVASGATNTPLTNTAPVNVTKATAAVGTASEAARQDHKHDITTGTPGSVSTANAEGSSTSLARSDHAHSGLKRDASDFDSFTEKTTPISLDILLIEDSADTYNKKKLKVGNLPKKWPFSKVITVDASDLDADYSTIQAAINAASAGTTILINPGVYAETITLKDGVDLVGLGGAGMGYPNSTTSGVWISRLMGTNTDLVSLISGSCSLSNIGILLSRSGSSPTLRAVVFSGTKLQLNNCRIEVAGSAFPNSCSFTTIAVSSGELTLIDCDVVASAEYVGQTLDYGLYISGAATVNAFNTRFTPDVSNTSQYNIYINNSSAVVNLNGCLVQGTCLRSSGTLNLYGGNQLDYGVDSDPIDGTGASFKQWDAVRIDGSNEQYKLNLKNVAGDVGSPANGDMWYNSSTGKFRAYENGAATNVIGGGSSVFGSDFQHAEDETRTTTTSSTYQDKVSLTTGALTGTYRVGWSAVHDCAANNRIVYSRLYNSTDAVAYEEILNQLSTTSERRHIGGFNFVTFTGSAKTFVIQFRSSQSGTTSGIAYAHIELWRVS